MIILRGTEIVFNFEGGEAVQNRDSVGSPGNQRTKEEAAVEACGGLVHRVIKYRELYCTVNYIVS
jgi:hypothetical protein